MAAESSLDKAQARLMRQLDIVEEIRGELEEQGIDLPGVVVCGEQSAGECILQDQKSFLCILLPCFLSPSSVLESLTGIDFPRNVDTCTRCPAVVRVRADPKCKEPYALIGSDAQFDLGNEKTKRVTLDKIGDEIARLTESLCQSDGEGGRGLLITKAPIHIKIVKPSGPTFTLIDLPGTQFMRWQTYLNDWRMVGKLTNAIHIIFYLLCRHHPQFAGRVPRGRR